MNKKTFIPLENNSFSRFLPWLVGFMVYLATLFSVIGYITKDAGDKWTAGITNSMSVQIVHPDNISPKKRQDILNRATVMIKQTNGVRSAKPIAKQSVIDLLVPWLGDGLEYTDLPIPDMIEVELEDNAYINIDEMRDNLSLVSEDLIIDNHQLWRQKVLAIVGSITSVVYTLTSLIFITSIIMVIATTIGLMIMNNQTLSMLVLMGATDHFIAREFTKHAYNLGLRSSISGFVVAYITVISLWYIGGQSGSALNIQQWLSLSLIIPATISISMIASYITVKSTLKKYFYTGI